MADIYRKSSLEKLSNPEQLDKMINISSPMSWLALVGVTLIIVATFIWAFKGTIMTEKTVSGVILSSDSIKSVYSFEEDSTQRSDMVALCCIPVENAKKIKADMTANISPELVDARKYGYIKGKTVFVEDLTKAVGSFEDVMGKDNPISQLFAANGPYVVAVCEITADESSQNAMAWTKEKGKTATVAEGSLISVRIVTDKCTPISKLINQFKDRGN